MPRAASPLAFRPGEKTGPGFIRILEQLAVQTRRLTRPSTASPEAVHAARLLIKRLRALLWFARPVFSARKREEAKARLRKASHLLSAQRDLAVTQAVLKKLSHRASDTADREALAQMAFPPDVSFPPKKSGSSLRQALALLLKALESLEEAARLPEKWPSPSKRTAKAFRVAKKAGDQALREGDDLLFHDWRKKTKCLLYQLELTGALFPRHAKSSLKRIDKLQEKLGDYHDSVVVQQRLRKGLSGSPSRRLAKRGVDLLEKRKKHLRKKARKIARLIKSLPLDK